jgi:hypothetical protein
MLPEAPADGPTAVGVSDTASLASTETPAVLVLVGVTDTASLSAADIATLFASGFYSASDTASLAATESASVEAIDESEPDTSAPSGGFLGAYDAWRAQRDRNERRRQEEAEEVEAISDEVSREIAKELREEERLEELRRLARLAEVYPATDIQDAKARVALERALERQTVAAFEALDRELRRAREEEEFVLLAVLLAA